MTTVKNLVYIDKKKLKSLKSFVESELELSVFQSFPIDFLHNMLPFRFKFMDESFVAFENKQIKGLITVNKAGDRRVKIKRLLLDENSYEIGKLLVNCIVPTYLGKGADSFYALVDKRDLPLITMFKEGLGFKEYAKETLYKLDENNKPVRSEEINFNHIRKMEKSDVDEVKNLTDELISPYKRPFFAKSKSELKKTILQNKEKYVISAGNNNIIGYFTIIRLNSFEYLLEFVIKMGFEGYAEDIIKYCWAKLIKKPKFKALYFKIKSYHSNYTELLQIFDIEYKSVQENEILVKDFYIQEKQGSEYEKMIFNDVTPAF